MPQASAVRSVQVGLGAGYVTGAATGVGLGAALAWWSPSRVRGRTRPDDAALVRSQCVAASCALGWPMPSSSSP